MMGSIARGDFAPEANQSSWAVRAEYEFLAREDVARIPAQLPKSGNVSVRRHGGQRWEQAETVAGWPSSTREALAEATAGLRAGRRAGARVSRARADAPLVVIPCRLWGDNRRVVSCTPQTHAIRQASGAPDLATLLSLDRGGTRM